jgi:hypothetical protein
MLIHYVCMHADALNIAGVNTGSGPIQYTRGNCTVRKVSPLDRTCPAHVRVIPASGACSCRSQLLLAEAIWAVQYLAIREYSSVLLRAA